MAGGVQARCEYGSLRLSCDEEAFARLRAHLLAEPTVAEAVGLVTDATGVRFIAIAAAGGDARHPVAVTLGCD